MGDGKFHQTSGSPPGDQVDSGAPGQGTMGHKISRSRQERSHNLSGEPWYQEVIELRKVANDYKVNIFESYIRILIIIASYLLLFKC